jgi:1,5-anhydro-D-fructose reductase (1,5-anhydro-D-mannitol-forming)
MKQIRWAMIGCGSVTEQKSGPGLYKAAGSTLVAVMSRTLARAEDWTARHGVGKAYDNIDRLLADEEIDAVYIATHPNTHRFYTLLCAGAGKAVYCEKPLGMNSEQSSQMVEYCNKQGVPFFSAYYRRALPKFLMIKEFIDTAAWGAVQAVHVQMSKRASESERAGTDPWRIQPEVSGGGHFHDIGSHALDLIDWYFGPITHASGSSANKGGYYQAPDVVHGHFTTQSGVGGTGLWTFNTYKDEDRTTIYFEDARLEYSVLDIAAPIILTTEEGQKIIEVPAPPAHVAQPLIQTVVDQLLGKGVCPSTGETGARTDRAIELLLGKR